LKINKLISRFLKNSKNLKIFEKYENIQEYTKKMQILEKIQIFFLYFGAYLKIFQKFEENKDLIAREYQNFGKYLKIF
jgi:phosphate starvation-inducible membrane PsiE